MVCKQGAKSCVAVNVVDSHSISNYKFTSLVQRQKMSSLLKLFFFLVKQSLVIEDTQRLVYVEKIRLKR